MIDNWAIKQSQHAKISCTISIQNYLRLKLKSNLKSIFCENDRKGQFFSSDVYCRPSENQLTISAINIWFLRVSVLWHIRLITQKSFCSKKDQKERFWKKCNQRNVSRSHWTWIWRVERYWKKSKPEIEVQEHYLFDFISLAHQSRDITFGCEFNFFYVFFSSFFFIQFIFDWIMISQALTLAVNRRLNMISSWSWSPVQV